MKPATPEEDREWKAVKEAYGKVSVPVVADESICSAEDVIAMKVNLLYFFLYVSLSLFLFFSFLFSFSFSLDTCYRTLLYIDETGLRAWSEREDGKSGRYPRSAEGYRQSAGTGTASVGGRDGCLLSQFKRCWYVIV